MDRREITIEDLLALRWIGDPQISPDGTRAVFVQRVVDKEADTYRSHLWMVPLDGSRPASQFTSGAHRDSSPRWSPDGRHIAFLSDRGAPPGAGAKKPKQIYVIPADGGEATVLTSGDLKPADLAWAPDGQVIAFAGKPEREPADSSDVRVITRVRYKFDGEGFWDSRYKHIFTIPVTAPPSIGLASIVVGASQSVQLTSGDFDHSSPVWSPDGHWLAFVANRNEDADFTNVADVWVMPATGGPPRRLTQSVGPISKPIWSPDGRRIAYYGHDNASMNATNTTLWVVPVEGGPPVNLTVGFDRSLTHHIITDMRAHPDAGSAVWSPDGSQIFTLIADGGSNQIGAVDAQTGQVRVLTAGRREVFGVSVDRACRRVVMAVSDAVTPGDLWVTDLADTRPSRERRLTAVNQPLLDRVALSVPEPFTYEGADGWTIEGWVLRPAGLVPGRRYPTILEIHGGPHGAYGDAFFHEFQVLAALGFALVYTNPRGSQGYGQAFTAATHHDWGGKDYDDIMRGLDAAIARFPFIDPERLGVAGGSYGGFMTNWVVGHTGRFKAAVTMRSISNHLSQWGTSDLAFMKGFWEFPGDPWETPTWYWERSPLAYVTKITTPLLILHSEQDLRCPIGEGEQLFAALKKLGRKVAFIRFPEESHDLSRNGKPTHRLERLRWIVRWFSEHILQAAPAPMREPATAGGVSHAVERGGEGQAEGGSGHPAAPDARPA